MKTIYRVVKKVKVSEKEANVCLSPWFEKDVYLAVDNSFRFDSKKEANEFIDLQEKLNPLRFKPIADCVCNDTHYIYESVIFEIEESQEEQDNLDILYKIDDLKELRGSE